MTTWPEERAHLVIMANELQALMTDDSAANYALVSGIMDNTEIVWAVWQDHAADDGFDVLLVKGQALLREIVAADGSRALSVAAIPCIDAEQAQALMLHAGEPDRRH